MGVLDRAIIRAEEGQIPFGFHLDLTYRCHQRCLHCFIPEAWRRGERADEELDTGQLKTILEQMAAAGTFLITFSGGEVFLRDDLFEVLTHARRLDFAISLMTTGTWGLGEEELRFLRNLGLNGLLMTMFSLDAGVHDRITATPGSWERLMGVVQTGKRLGLPVVLNCIAFPLNRGDLQELRRFTDDWDIPLRLDTQLVDRWDGQEHLPGLVLSPEERLSVRREMGLPIDDPAAEPHTTISEEIPGGCGAGCHKAYLTPGGEVWPCMDVPWPCGRLERGKQFADIWENSPTLKRVRRLYEELNEPNVRLCDVFQPYLT